MGFTPAQVNEMTAWEFMCCLEAFNAAHGGKAAAGGGADADDADLRAMGIEGF